MTLPSPGPGRPHHRSYAEPMRPWSAREVAAMLLLLVLLVCVAEAL